MTRQEHSTALEQAVELVAQHGTDAIGAAFATLLDIGMRREREQALGAAATSEPTLGRATPTVTSRRPSTPAPVA